MSKTYVESDEKLSLNMNDVHVHRQVFVNLHMERFVQIIPDMISIESVLFQHILFIHCKLSVSFYVALAERTDEMICRLVV